MSDFGTDTGNASVIVMSKVMEAMMRLMEKVYQTWKETPDRKLKSQQIKDLKSKRNIEKAREKLDGKAGYIRLQLLKKAKVPLKSFSIDVSTKDMAAFSDLCRREDVLFSGIVHKGTDTEKRQYKLICKEEDLGKIEQIVKRLNYEKQIEAIEKRIAEIRSKSELSEQDQIDINYLESEQEKIKKHICEEMNRLAKEELVEKAFSGEMDNSAVKKQMTFDEALNNFTGRRLDKDMYTIVADVSDPDKIVRCHYYESEFKGKNYIKTDYEVYVNNQKVYSCNDGKYENRPWNYWTDIKESMKEAGHFSDKLLKFYRQEDYENWAQKVREKTSIEFEKKESGNKEELQRQLQEKGCRYEEGKVYQNDMPISNENTDISEKLENGEKVLIGKQIRNTEQLEVVKQNIINLKAEEILAKEGSKEQMKISEEIEQLEKKQQKLQEEQREFMELRKGIIAAKVQDNIENDMFDKDKMPDIDRYQMKEAMEKYQGEIDRERNRNEKVKQESKKIGKRREQRDK